jgi:hypothetical protein
LLGENHPDTLISMNNLARIYARAERLRIEVLEARRRALVREHPDTLTSVGNLAVLYRDQGKLT